MSCLHYRTLCTRQYIFFPLFPFTIQWNGPMLGKPQIMLNGSQPSYSNTQTSTTWRHRIRLRALFRSRLFYDYFPFALAPGGWRWLVELLCVISCSLHDNLFLITSNQSWRFLCEREAIPWIILGRKICLLGPRLEGDGLSSSEAHNKMKTFQLDSIYRASSSNTIQCQTTSASSSSAKFRMAWNVVKLLPCSFTCFFLHRAQLCGVLDVL